MVVLDACCFLTCLVTLCSCPSFVLSAAFLSLGFMSLRSQMVSPSIYALVPSDCTAQMHVTMFTNSTTSMCTGLLKGMIRRCSAAARSPVSKERVTYNKHHVKDIHAAVSRNLVKCLAMPHSLRSAWRMKSPSSGGKMRDESGPMLFHHCLLFFPG